MSSSSTSEFAWQPVTPDIVGGADDDTLYGGKGRDQVDGLDIVGGADDDTLNGGIGRDQVDGGGGLDTVAYNGRYDAYRVTYDAGTDTYTVVNLASPDRDVDTLKNIERLRFADLDAPIADTSSTPAPDQQPLRHRATKGDDHLVGGDLEYLLSGGDGNDLLEGNGGDDRLYGGKGEDTAVYRGDLADYDLSFDPDERQFRLTDRVSGRDGSDLLSGIEKLRFGDLTVLLAVDGAARIDGGAQLLAPYEWPVVEFDPGMEWNGVDPIPCDVGITVIGVSTLSAWDMPAADA